jgi:hypothetical protein
MSKDQEELAGSSVGVDGARDWGEVTFRAPVLELGAATLESKEGRREALSRLDHILEQLERANLADLRRPPSRLVRALAERGLSDPRAYTIPQLLEIVFSSQERLMRANRNARGIGGLDDREDERVRYLEFSWE